MVTPLLVPYNYSAYSNFVIPGDKKYNPNNNKVIISVNLNISYNLIIKPDMNKKEFTKDFQTELHVKFEVLFRIFIKTYCNVVIGEFAVEKIIPI